MNLFDTKESKPYDTLHKIHYNYISVKLYRAFLFSFHCVIVMLNSIRLACVTFVDGFFEHKVDFRLKCSYVE